MKNYLLKQLRFVRENGISVKRSYRDAFTTSTGLTLSTVEELLSFCLYHEGMHFATIKSYKRIIQDERKNKGI